MKNWHCLSSVCLLILFASGASLAQEPSASPTSPGVMVVCELCTTITVSCPSDIEVGKPLEFKGSLSNPTAKLTYTWEVVGGLIAEGQGTLTISVNRIRRQSDNVTATLRVGGLDAACSTIASCSTGSHRPQPRAEKVDSYGAVPFTTEKAKLDVLAAVLVQNSGTEGYILGYSGRRSRAGETRKAVDRAKAYLISKPGIDQERIITVDGGLKERSLVELWLVPTGAHPPAASPTVDPAELKLTKSTANKSPKRPREH